MFPQFVHTGTAALVKKTCSLSQASRRLVKAVTRIASANATTSGDNLEKIYELAKNFPTSKAILRKSAAPIKEEHVKPQSSLSNQTNLD